MAKDFMQKEPTKNEKMFYEIAMHLNDLDHRTWSVSSHVLALGILLGVNPQKLAELLTGDEAKLKDYAQKINDAIQKIKEAKGNKSGAEKHDHQHSHEGHNH